MEHLLDSDGLAEVLKIEPEDVERLVEQGQLRAYRIGGALRFRESDVNEFLETCRVSTNGQPTRKPTSTTSTAPRDDTRKQCKTFAGRATFPYTGSVATGTSLWPGQKAHFRLQISAEQWRALLDEFQGREVLAGLNFATPEEGSMGAWIKEHWHTKMGPAAYVGGILIAEGYATRPRRGWIRFHNKRQTPNG